MLAGRVALLEKGKCLETLLVEASEGKRNREVPFRTIIETIADVLSIITHDSSEKGNAEEWM